MIEIVCARELGETAKKRISEIFVDAFGHHLSFFSKDRNKLAKALEHMFVLDVFHVAVIDGEIAGMAACTVNDLHSVKHDRNELRKHFGIYKGTIANVVFKREFQKPIKVGKRTALIKFFATDSRFRGQGVARAIMNHLMDLPQYDAYILEVADTNTRAIRMYEKLGFREFERFKQKYSRLSGVNYMIYMKYTKGREESEAGGG
jgi:ribosomal protein S18 acetylase RimI-like enzyme